MSNKNTNSNNDTDNNQYKNNDNHRKKNKMTSIINYANYSNDNAHLTISSNDTNHANNGKQNTKKMK